MKRSPLIRAVVGLALPAVVGCSQVDYKLYGEPLAMSPSRQIDVAKVLSNPTTYNGKTVRLVGNIDELCAHKGCWVTMSDGERTLRVKFTCPIEGRLVPLQAKGRRAVVEGRFEYKEVPEADARHYLEDQGASAAEIARINGPQMEFFMRSEGILIEEGGRTSPTTS